MKDSLHLLLKDKIALIAAVLFVSGLAFLWLAGATELRGLASSLVAAYLIVWGLIALVSKAHRVEIRKQFVLATMTLAFCLMLAEVPVLVGLIDYRHVLSAPIPDEWEKPHRVIDSELLHIYEPHYEAVGTYTRGNIGEHLCLPPGKPFQYDLKYDQNGFRNSEDLVYADIAVVGDSYVESPMLPSSVIMTTVLQQLQGSKVANLGIQGYGPQQELVVLKRYALSLQPKTILWVFYEGNDLADAREYEKTLAQWQKGESRIHKRWIQSFTRNTLDALLRLNKGCIPHQHYAKRYGTLRDAQGDLHRIYFLGSNYGLLTPSELDALRTTESTIAAAYQLCKERGIQFVVVFAPGTYRVYHGLPNLIDVSEEVRWWAVNDLPERLRSILQSISPEIGYLDLTPVLRAEAEKGTFVFLHDDTHWTQEGHRIVGRVLSDFLSIHSTTNHRS
jgi:hypothetical protein